MRLPGLALAALVAVLGSGCDPTATQPDAKAGKDAAKPSKAAPSEVAACIDRCRSGPGDRRTDAETCRLLCEDPSAGTPTTVDTVLARHEACVETCRPSSSSDRATCTLNCAGSIPAVVSEVDAKARTCMRPCLQTLGECNGGCTGGSDTNRETCRLQCDANARSCLSDCLAPAG